MIQDLKLLEYEKRFSRLGLAEKQELRKGKNKNETPHVVYAMSHVGVSGGVKMILEHTNRLKRAGISVSIVTHFERPSWYPIEANYIQVPWDLELAKGIPPCDVIVATYWDHIQPCIESGIAPVVYFEQGDFHIFEYETMNKVLKKYIDKQFTLPEFIFTVSKSTADYIEEHYHRKAAVIPNAIDETVFSEHIDPYQHSKPYLLMVGAESAKFKGIADIIQAYNLLIEKEVEIDLLWITPEEPSDDLKKKVTKYFTQPEQNTIASLYKGAAVYISASHYESFSLPPLEAMACSCPVVVTNNKGVLEYAQDQENSLICEIKNAKDIAEKVQKLLFDKRLRKRLIENGILTAKKYNWNEITQKLIAYYKEVCSFDIIPRNNISNWDIVLTEEMCLYKEDFVKFIKLLQSSKADFIQVPVVYDIDGFIQTARWEVVANRKNSMGTCIDRCYCPISPPNHLSILNEKAYRGFVKREWDEALEEFSELYTIQKEPLAKAVYFRWMILCLYRLQRVHEAKSKLKDWLEKNSPHYSTEIHFLQCLLEGRKDPASYQEICLLGDVTSNTEFIFNVKGQLDKLK